MEEADQKRHRIDLASNVYQKLDARARWLGVTPAALAAMLIEDGLERHEVQQSRVAARKKHASSLPVAE